MMRLWPISTTQQSALSLHEPHEPQERNGVVTIRYIRGSSPRSCEVEPEDLDDTSCWCPASWPILDVLKEPSYAPLLPLDLGASDAQALLAVKLLVSCCRC